LLPWRYETVIEEYIKKKSNYKYNGSKLLEYGYGTKRDPKYSSIKKNRQILTKCKLKLYKS